MTERRFWGLIAIVAGVLATVQILSIRQEAQIWDEGFEIVGGYQYLTTGQYRTSVENPPLERILEALPLLILRPDLKGAALEAHNTATSDVDAGVEFLYHNRIPAGTILFAARLPMIGVTAGLVCVLAGWCRKRFGAMTGIIAAVLFSLDPTVIAHGRYVKNDMTVTATAFLAVIAWEWFLESGTRPALIWPGIALGLALGSKFSAVFLLPVFLVLYLLREWREFSLVRFLKSFAVVAALATAVILVLYAPYAGALLPRGRGSAGVPLRDGVDQATAFGRGVAWLGSRLGWRDHPFLAGLTHFVAHGGGTHSAYLWGNYGNTGWWYYFPFAFAVKTPVAVLMAVAVVMALAILKVRWTRIPLLKNSRKTERGSNQALGRLEVRAAPFALLRNLRKTERGSNQVSTRLEVRAAPFVLLRNSRKTERGSNQVLGRLEVRAAPFALPWFALLVPIVFYGALSASGHVDIGLRHLLPIYPFLYALLAAGLVVPRWRFKTPVIAVILLGAAAESLAAYPYYTAFFNVAVGGPKNGPKLLVDSNIDWGQDLKRLGWFSADHGSPRMCISYFGTAPAWYYVPRAGNFPTIEELRGGADLGCEFAAVSVTPLEGVYVPRERFAWLRDVPPLARVGYSIYVWDVHDPGVGAALARLRGGAGTVTR